MSNNTAEKLSTDARQKPRPLPYPHVLTRIAATFARIGADARDAPEAYVEECFVDGGGE